MNVLSKMVAPKVVLTAKYITSELEEIEREDNFRLKRFKELKTKRTKSNNKDKVTSNICCCDNKPGKGDDSICPVCQTEEENRNKSKNVTYSYECKSQASDVIGDKPSSLSIANKKRLDELSTHLEVVINLTNQCKTEGLISPSADSFICACKKVMCKLEKIDQPLNSIQTPQDKPCTICEEITAAQNSCDADKLQKGQDVCNTCKGEKRKDVSCPLFNERNIGKTQDIPREISANNCFKTEYKEFLKVFKTIYDDGTVSEEKQVITIKTEKKHSHELRTDPCKDDIFCKQVKKTISEVIPNFTPGQQTKVRLCDSDTKNDMKNKAFKLNCKANATESKTPTLTVQSWNYHHVDDNKSGVHEETSKILCCKKVSLTESKSSPYIADISSKLKACQNVCSNTKCPSKTGSSKSKISEKSSKNVCCDIKRPSQTGNNKLKEIENSVKICNEKTKSHISLNNELPSKIGSGKSNVSEKSIMSSKHTNSKKDVSFSGASSTKSICSNLVLKDVSCCTTNITECSEETEEKCIFVHETDISEKQNKTLCCHRRDDEKSKDKLNKTEKCPKCSAKVQPTQSSDKCPQCAKEQSKLNFGKCPYCPAKQETIPSDKCLQCAAKQEGKSGIGKCPRCAITQHSSPRNTKCPECDAKVKSKQCTNAAEIEKKSSTDKYPYSSLKQDTKSRSEKCLCSAPKQDTKANTSKCTVCKKRVITKHNCVGTTKEESQVSSGKSPQCGKKQESKSSTGKCNAKVITKHSCVGTTKEESKVSAGISPQRNKTQESKSSTGTCNTKVITKHSCVGTTKEESKISSGKSPQRTKKQESKSKCPECDAIVDKKQSCDKCPDCAVKRESKATSVKSFNENKNDQKIRIVSKQKVGRNKQTVKEIVVVGNIRDVLKQLLLPDADSKNESSDKADKSSCSCSTLPNGQSPGNDSSKAVHRDKDVSSCPSCTEENESYCESLTFSTCKINDKESKCPIIIPKNTQSCPVLDNQDQKYSSLKQSKSEKSCCSTRKKLICISDDEVIKKDASTITRRSDRYDVRPLKLMKSRKKLACECKSDSILYQCTEKQIPRKFKSCNDCFFFIN